MTAKLLIVASLLLLSIKSQAQEAKALVMKSADEVEQNFVTNNIRSISYEGEQMIITLRNDEKYAFAINEVKSMTFSSVVTAIESIIQGSGAVPFSIFDINGTKILSGMTDSYGKIDAKINLGGVYVIKVGEKTQKIVVLKK